MIRRFVYLGAVLMSVISMSSYAGGAQEKDGKFLNNEVEYSSSFGNVVDIVGAYITTKREAPTPKEPMLIRPIPAEELRKGEEPVLYRLGHSTILIRMDGEYILTDPVFSDRASPVQWAGPKRFHPTPISIKDLPAIKAVVISHDHYDHLDKAAVRELATKVEYFVTPLKVGNHLREWGIAENKIIELDWWQNTQLGSFTFTATPSQHFSGRGLLDRDETLWASWVIKGEQANLFFSGDSGYFSGFKEIGEKYGPFDITMIETGAYNSLWKEIHMMPEEGLQAHIDLKGKAMLPIHNSTFDLSMHDWFEPLETIHRLAEQKQVNLLTPMIGARVSINKLNGSSIWWRETETVMDNLQPAN